MSVAKSFFDITTGRSHGVVPTSDAIRIVLDSGATLLMDRENGAVRARAAWPTAASGEVARGGGPLCPTFTSSIEATGERIDKALSALIGELVLGKAGVEVTEWTIRPPEDARRTDVKHVQFGRIGVPLFACKDEDEITQKLVRVVEEARRGQGDRINAVVVRLPGSDEVGIACLPGKPEPPVGATLTGRRMVGGMPHADVPWEQVKNGRFGLLRRTIDVLKRDCELAGLDVRSRIPELSLLLRDGRETPLASVVLSWTVDYDSLSRIISDLALSRVHSEEPVALRMTAVRLDK